jgi:hypothetical protein
MCLGSRWCRVLWSIYYDELYNDEFGVFCFHILFSALLICDMLLDPFISVGSVFCVVSE